jgi:hypothetical protein
MNEAEWLASADPARMLQFLGTRARDRKVRLLVIACCRRQRHTVREHDALDLLELHADGRLSGRRSKEAARVAYGLSTVESVFIVQPARRFAPAALDHFAAISDQPAGQSAAESPINAARRVQADMIRCVFGNPFHPPAAPASWLAWNDGAIRKMAQPIYDARAFDRLPLLADALEDAGCTDADILSHCRNDSEHVRGCWVVDLLLGKS